jgi:hypothetical protein
MKVGGFSLQAARSAVAAMIRGTFEPLRDMVSIAFRGCSFGTFGRLRYR